jgi:hypothetical protein
MSVLTRAIDGVLDVVLSPALWLGVLLAVVCSLLFYGWRGGDRRQFGRDAVAALVGFAAGQMAAAYLQLDLLRLGQLEIVGGIVGAAVALFLGRLVWRPGAGTA